MELKGRQSKHQLRELLSAKDIRASIETICRFPVRQSVNFLFSFFYDKDEMIRWRAIAAFGQAVSVHADKNMESARIIMRRLMWNLNDESGGIVVCGGSPEAMGEVMAIHQGLAKEFSHILRSYIRVDENFLEYEMLQRGVIWGIGRLAEARAECLPKTDIHLHPFLESGDAYHRAFAAWALGSLKSRDSSAALERLAEDKNGILFFNDLELKSLTVGMLAEEALKKIEM